MCGIFSCMNNDEMVPSNVLYDAFKLGSLRGPEYSEYLHIKSSIVGFHRLAINGLNQQSKQPMTIDKITLICNGEIYNFKELYSMIDLVPETNSDCEVIIHLYKKFGMDYMLTLLDGYFSFILYDSRHETREPDIYIARDTYGVRPLYMLQDKINPKSIVAFASELKMLNKIMHVAENHNLFIQQYPPGTYSILSKDTHYTFTTYAKRYSSSYLFHPIMSSEMELDDTYKTVYNALYSAVKKRVIGTTDRKIACLLSGGLDSSLIAALVSKFYDGELETYSIGMPGGEDLGYAKMVANHIGSKHTEIILTEDAFFDAIPKVIQTIESYDTTTVRASVGNYLICKHISETSDAKVVFNGDGSDELTGGYLYFHLAPDALSFDHEIRRLLNDIHLFDVLRSDKSISSNGLEPRTPFLDLHFVNTYLGVPLKHRYTPNKPEKWLLRKSVEMMDNTLLPKTVLWRKKEAFSDGVSSNDKSWYEIIREKVSDIHISNTYSYLPPKTNEQYYYRSLFESFYPKCERILPYFWMPKFVNAEDSSARSLSIYVK